MFSEHNVDLLFTPADGVIPPLEAIYRDIPKSSWAVKHLVVDKIWIAEDLPDSVGVTTQEGPDGALMLKVGKYDKNDTYLGDMVARVFIGLDSLRTTEGVSGVIERVAVIEGMVANRNPLPYAFSRHYIVPSGIFVTSEALSLLSSAQVPHGDVGSTAGTFLIKLRNSGSNISLPSLESFKDFDIETTGFEYADTCNKSMGPSVVLFLCRELEKKKGGYSGIYDLVQSLLTEFSEDPNFRNKTSSFRLLVHDGIMMLTDERMRGLIPPDKIDLYYRLMSEYLCEYAFMETKSKKDEPGSSLAIANPFPLEVHGLKTDITFIPYLLNIYENILNPVNIRNMLGDKKGRFVVPSEQIGLIVTRVQDYLNAILARYEWDALPENLRNRILSENRAFRFVLSLYSENRYATYLNTLSGFNPENPSLTIFKAEDLR